MGPYPVQPGGQQAFFDGRFAHNTTNDPYLNALFEGVNMSAHNIAMEASMPSFNPGFAPPVDPGMGMAYQAYQDSMALLNNPNQPHAEGGEGGGGGFDAGGALKGAAGGALAGAAIGSVVPVIGTGVGAVVGGVVGGLFGGIF